jgi:hypothetical protein
MNHEACRSRTGELSHIVQIVELFPQAGLVNGHWLGSFLRGGGDDRHPLASQTILDPVS